MILKQNNINIKNKTKNINFNIRKPHKNIQNENTEIEKSQVQIKV